MSEQQDNKKKKFISEKIVGRELTASHTLKYLALAIICGLCFGAFASLAFLGVQKLGILQPGAEVQQESLAADAADTGEDAEKTLQSEAEPASAEAHSEKEAQGTAVSDGTQENEANAAQDTVQREEAPVQEAEGMVPEADASEGERLAAVIREELENYQFTEQDMQSMLGAVRKQASLADTHVVSVQAVERETGWFNDEIETAYVASGLIVSTTDPEILILTTESAVRNADNLSVTFKDGTVQEAFLRAASQLDGAAVLAVPKTGLGSEFLSSISPITFGNSNAAAAGDMIVAIGSPFGVTHSMDMGFVGYVMSNEQTADGTRDILYSDISSNAEQGTFIANLNGECIGMVKPSGEGNLSGRTGVLSASYVKEMLLRLSEGRSLPYLGLEGRTVSTEMEFKNIPSGVYVTRAVTDSPAYAAGVKSGDVIVGLNDVVIKDMTGYEAAVKKLETGTAAVLKVMRSSTGGEYKELVFTIPVGAR